ncbi:DUF2997 domain-containing protein [Micromonospora sp. DSM 115977]|uniref:DUF2997 domain-containing protein n=1 Tax=Micromonospora reichwaldensis TaxID=3075516 RepID=A0ABU2WWW2_9ACTN|nr:MULTISPECIES: DUF2997 domain-containing protein [unclassified Micromonospora]MDT0530416.1 DUF2997 domain-containing protein [Micromonospora sp. DSM 115977]WSG04513.1 DUF2997 domain-containing protein [Micromonospora sp. NBC_01740]
MGGQPRIVVTVTSEGVVSAETRDVLGDGCLDYIAVLEDLLAARTVRSAYTADRDRAAVPERQEQRDVERA